MSGTLLLRRLIGVKREGSGRGRRRCGDDLDASTDQIIEEKVVRRLRWHSGHGLSNGVRPSITVSVEAHSREAEYGTREKTIEPAHLLLFCTTTPVYIPVQTYPAT
jgi:hypothetical protein